MKNTLLWSALCALISTPINADQTQQVTLPAQAPSSTAVPTPAPPSIPTPTPPSVPTPALTTTQTPAQAAPAIPMVPTQQTQPIAAPMVDCNYKIPAQTKKIDQTVVLNWSQNAVAQAFSFDPAALDAQMQKLQACFTEQGWTGFSTALQKSGNLEAIKSQKLSVTSRIEGMTLITEAKDNQWKVTVPLVVVYQNEKEKVSQLLSVDLTVSRKPSGDLGIMQMIAIPRGTVTTKTPEQPVNNPENTSLDTKPTDADFAPTQRPVGNTP